MLKKLFFCVCILCLNGCSFFERDANHWMYIDYSGGFAIARSPGALFANLTNELTQAKIKHKVATRKKAADNVVTITFGEKSSVWGLYRIYCDRFNFSADVGCVITCDVMVDYQLACASSEWREEFARIDNLIEAARCKSGWGYEYSVAFSEGTWNPTNELHITHPVLMLEIDKEKWEKVEGDDGGVQD